MKQRITLSNLFACLFLSISFMMSSYAQVVTSSADDGTDGTLRSEIEDTPEGGTITFSVNNVMLNSALSLDKNLTIMGGDADKVTIDAQHTSRIFTIISGTVNLHNLILKNGTADEGGAISVMDADLMLDNVDIMNSTANGASGSGGAIIVKNGAKLTATNSVFTNNTANRAGGAIEGAYGSADGIVLTDTDFMGNNAGVSPAMASPGNGGAIHITGAGNIKIKNGTFSANTAASEGGALWNGTGTMTIVSSKIIENIAYGDDADNGGGGIFNNGGTLDISGTANINQNMAAGISGSGGGILSTSGMVNVNDMNMISNKANRAGGGIEIIDGTMLIRDSEITNNRFVKANPGNGGGIHVTGIANVHLIGGNVNGNQAPNEGGGLWNQKGSTMDIEYTWVINNDAYGNKAQAGGAGIYNNGGDLNIYQQARIVGNRARGASASGGGILSVDGNIIITDALVYENRANRAGGAIELIEGVLEVTNSKIYDNYFGDAPKPGNGGALHVTGSATVTFNGGSVYNNIAPNEGGALWNGSGIMTINGTTISNNTAAGSTIADPLEIKGGGAIFANDNGTLIINEGTLIDGNFATGAGGSGGGILMATNSTLKIMGSADAPVTLSNNAANRAGGAIEDWSLNTSVSMLDYVNFKGNSAGVDIPDFTATATPGNGGAIHITGPGSMNINDASATGNMAAAEGGAFWNSAATMTIYDSNFDSNMASGADATNGGGALFNNGGTLNVWNSSITNNEAKGASGSGGGIQNVDGGSLTVNNTIIAANMAMRAGGGIEDNSAAGVGSVRLSEVTLAENTTGSAPGNGGGFHLTGPGNSWLERVTVSNNSAANEGGGVWNGSGNMNISTSTISGNSTEGDGGGIYNLAGGIFVSASTVVNNTATGIGGGIDNDPMGGQTTLRSSIVALNNASTGKDLGDDGSFVSSDYNLIGQDDLNVFTAKANDSEGTSASPIDPMIGPLADNGGPTQTHELMKGSLAYNAGNPNDMDPDQRGEPVFGARRDMGSYEAQSSLGIGDMSSFALSESALYPNPSTGSIVNLNIPDGASAEIRISVIEIGSGKVVLRQEGRAGVNQLNITALARGAYVVKMVTGSTVESLKMIVGR